MVFTPETVDVTRASQDELRQRISQEYMRSVEANNSEPSEESYRQFVQSHDEYPNLSNMDEMRQNTVARLRHQAIPAQVNILHKFGKANPSLLELHRNPREALAKM